MEKLQHERDTWNEQRLQRIDYVNQKLKEQGHAERTFQNVNEAMQQYSLLTGEPLLGAEPQLYDYLEEDQKTALHTGELAIVGVGMIITGYLTYRYVAK